MKPMEEKEIVFFVSLDGRDVWSGRRKDPAHSRKDGPFATPARALTAVREFRRRNPRLDRPIRVVLRHGTYFLEQPLVFTPADSGTAQSPVIWSSYPGEEATLSAGRELRGWQYDATRRVAQLILPAVRKGKWFFRELWIDGARRSRCRHPARGYSLVTGSPDAKVGGEWGVDCRRLAVQAGAFEPDLDLTDAELVYTTKWVECRSAIRRVDRRRNVVTLEKPGRLPMERDPFYVENSADTFPQPGRWVLESAGGRLRYQWLAGEDLPKANVVAPVHPHVIVLAGRPERKRYVEHLRFEGLVFAHTQWHLPPDISGFGQADIGVPGAVSGTGVRQCAFCACRFQHLGTYGLELKGGCQDNRIEQCVFSDLGAGGIKIGEPLVRLDPEWHTCRNTVAGCRIVDGGHVFHCAVGLWIGQSFENRIQRNSISDFFYSGISIGWTWGYGPSLAHHNLVEGNEVHHIGLKRGQAEPILSDMGAIYTLGVQPGTIIRSNCFHDVVARNYGGGGIYLDEGSSAVTVEGNIVYRTTHGSFNLHYGGGNVVRNNIFASPSKEAPISAGNATPFLALVFADNIVHWMRGPLTRRDLTGCNVVFDRNRYSREQPARHLVHELSLKEWQEFGQDRHSRLGDPFPDLLREWQGITREARRIGLRTARAEHRLAQAEACLRQKKIERFLDCIFALRQTGFAEQVRSERVAEIESGESGNLNRRSKGGRPWLIIGPFDSSDQKGLDREYLDERRPAKGEAGGRRIYYDLNDWVPLDRIFRAETGQVPTSCLAYAYTRVWSPAARSVQLLIGSDDGIKLLLNGEAVFRIRARRSFTPAENQVTAQLKKGWNDLLAKIEQLDGNWEFSVTFTGLQGETLADLRFDLPNSAQGRKVRGGPA
jgi:parallel beta-helix repeat protein